MMTVQDFFPVAVWYNGSFARPPMMPRIPLQPKKVRRDLKQIKELGFNSVKYWIDWATCSPRPGKTDFSPVKAFLKFAEEAKLRVIVQIYLDSAPNWIAKQYPDSLFTSQGGQRVESQASPGYSLDHPKVKKEVSTFLKSLSKLLANNSVVFAWDVWSEPHVVNWSWFDYMGPEPWFDYNYYSQERFKSWLRKKYKSIEKLNSAWYRTYSDWDEVRIPKYVTLSTYKDILDWQAFTVQKMKEDLKFRVDCIRSLDKNHLIASHSAITSTMTSIMDWGANGNDWEMSKVVDVWGTSYYPAHIGSLNPYDPQISGLFLDASRSSCDSSGVPFWIGELQSGQAVEGLKFGIPVGAKEITEWAWTCLSVGAKGLFFYAYYPMSCGEEISGFGMLPFSGKINERAKASGAISKIINENKDIFLHSRPPQSKVAILVSSTVTAMLTALRAKQSILSSSLMGTYRILHQEGIYPDFVDFDNLKMKYLMNYKIIFAPLMLSLDEKRADMLKKYVANGGTLISEFRPGWSDLDGNNLSVVPGLGLDSLFSVIEDHVIDEKNLHVVSIRENSEIKFDYNGLCEVLKPIKAKVIATLDEKKPVVTSYKYGKGNAVYVGMLLSSFFENTRNAKINEFVISLMGERAEDLRVSSFSPNSQLEVRELQYNGTSLVFVFNHSISAISSAHVYLSKTHYKTAVDITNHENLEIANRKGKQTITLRLAEHETKVVLLN